MICLGQRSVKGPMMLYADTWFHTHWQHINVNLLRNFFWSESIIYTYSSGSLSDGTSILGPQSIFIPVHCPSSHSAPFAVKVSTWRPLATSKAPKRHRRPRPPPCYHLLSNSSFSVWSCRSRSSNSWIRPQPRFELQKHQKPNRLSYVEPPFVLKMP